MLGSSCNLGLYAYVVTSSLLKLNFAIKFSERFNALVHVFAINQNKSRLIHQILSRGGDN